MRPEVPGASRPGTRWGSALSSKATPEEMDRPGDRPPTDWGGRRPPSAGIMAAGALFPAALLLIVAGCSGGGTAGLSASQPAATSSLSVSTPPTMAPSLPTDVSTSLNAIEALQKHTCSAGPDGVWTFTGTLVNTADKAKTYSVAVAVAVGAAVHGHTLITKTVQPGKSAEVSAANFAETAEHAGTCEPVVSVEDAK